METGSIIVLRFLQKRIDLLFILIRMITLMLKTIPIHLETLKHYKGKDNLEAIDVAVSEFNPPGQFP